MKKFFPVLLVIVLLLVGGVVYVQFSNNPQKVLARAVEAQTTLKYVHADFDIDQTVSYEVGGQTVAQDVSMKGFSDADMTKKAQKMHMQMSTSGVNIDMDAVLLPDGEMYLGMPMLKQALKKDWVRVNTKDLKEDGSLPIDPQSSDYITQSIGFLKSVDSKAIVKLEDDVVDGVKTAHFRADVTSDDYAKYMDSLVSDGKWGQMVKDTSIKADYWVDLKSGRIARTSVEIKNMKIFGGDGEMLGKSDMKMDITFSKFDQAVEVGVPTGTVIDYGDIGGTVKGLNTWR